MASKNCLVGLVATNTTAEQEILGLLSGSGKVLLGLSIRNFSGAVTLLSLDFYPVDDNRLPLDITSELKT